MTNCLGLPRLIKQNPNVIRVPAGYGALWKLIAKSSCVIISSGLATANLKMQPLFLSCTFPFSGPVLHTNILHFYSILLSALFLHFKHVTGNLAPNTHIRVLLYKPELYFFSWNLCYTWMKNITFGLQISYSCRWIPQGIEFRHVIVI